MSEENKNFFEEFEFMCDLLDEQASSLNAIIFAFLNPTSSNNEKINNPEAKDWYFVVAVLMISALHSTVSLTSLTRDLSVKSKDGFGIARTIIETITNIIYVLASGYSEADAAIRHYKQKSFRNINLEKKYGRLIIKMRKGSQPDLKDIPDMEEMLKEFTNKQGRELNWPKIPVITRLEKIRSKFGEKVHAFLVSSHFLIYSNASEIMHGSFFGAMYFMGGTSPISTPNERNLKKETVEQIKLLHISTAMSFIALYKSLDKVLESDVFTKASEKSWDRITEIHLSEQTNN